MAITKLSKVHGRRKSRNVGLGLTLGGFVLLVLILSMVKIAGTGSVSPEFAEPDNVSLSGGRFEEGSN